MDVKTVVVNQGMLYLLLCQRYLGGCGVLFHSCGGCLMAGEDRVLFQIVRTQLLIRV